MSLRDPKLTLRQMREYAEQARDIAASTTAASCSSTGGRGWLWNAPCRSLAKRPRG